MIRIRSLQRQPASQLRCRDWYLFMIGWLEGLIVYKLQRGNRSQITLNCNGVGYEVQITQREWLNLENDQTIQLWIHQSISADSWQFFRFQINA